MTNTNNTAAAIAAEIIATTETRCEAHGAADWADARDQFEGCVPEETLDAFERFYLENDIAWAQVQ